MSPEHKICAKNCADMALHISKLEIILSDIEELALFWDGRESSHYGNKILHIIHKDWYKE